MSAKISDTKSLKWDLIGMKKPSSVDKIMERVPKPRGAVPNFGPQRWKFIPLESKIPMIPSATAYNLTRGKLGKNIWIGRRKNIVGEFNLNDPCNYEIKMTYDSLHDHHLARYFSRKANIRRMLKLGFVTDNLDAKCSLKDYNMYRKYLKKLHNDSVNRELKRQPDLADEKRVIEFAEFAGQREIGRLKMKERQSLKKKERDEAAREELKRAREKKREERIKQGSDLAKNQEMQKRFFRAQRANGRIGERPRQNNDKNDALVNRLVALARRETKRREARKNRLIRQAEEERLAIQEKLKRRMDEEEKEMARKESALRYAQQQRQAFIERYTKKVERSRAKLLRDRRSDKTPKFVVNKCHVAGENSACQERRCSLAH